jgi:hypothetical protein
MNNSENIIKNSRVVSDITFATRLLSFAKSVDASCAMGAEEKDYIISVATKLLDHQKSTVTDEHEVDYLKRNEL